MQWSRKIVGIVLIGIGLAFGVWQYRGWRQQRQLVQESVEQQSTSVMNALLGAIRSHRRPGRFFESQLDGLLQGLVASPDVLAVRVSDDAGHPILAAGDLALMSDTLQQTPGTFWEPSGFVRVEPFTLPPTSELELPGPGRGLGRQPAGASAGETYDLQGTLTAVLVLDRKRADRILRAATWSYGLATAAGALVLAGLAVAWRSSLRLIEEHARAELFSAQSRHFQDLSQAAAGLAHETRNPLGLVRGWAERLGEAGLTDDERQARARSMVEECDRITARINQFLAFARPVTPDLSPVPIRSLVEELRMLLEPDLEASGVTLLTNELPADVTVQADAELLRQALFNLLQNAVEFSPPQGIVEVRWSPDPQGGCRLDVCDRGPGVAREDEASLFSPYFTTRPGGTGLGLAIVRRISVAHNWRTSYRPRTDGGAVFSLEGLNCGQEHHPDRG